MPLPLQPKTLIHWLKYWKFDTDQDKCRWSCCVGFGYWPRRGVWVSLAPALPSPSAGWSSPHFLGTASEPGSSVCPAGLTWRAGWRTVQYPVNTETSSGKIIVFLNSILSVQRNLAVKSLYNWTLSCQYRNMHPAAWTMADTLQVSILYSQTKSWFDMYNLCLTLDTVDSRNARSLLLLLYIIISPSSFIYC